MNPPDPATKPDPRSKNMSDVATIEFLQALYSDPVRPGRLMLRTCSRKDGKQRSHWLHTLFEATTEAHRSRPSRETYFSVPLHNPKRAIKLTRELWPRIAEPSARACEASAVALPALWAEIAVGGAGRPPDRAAAYQLLDAIPLPASIIVDASGSYQVYWLLRELWILDTPAERAKAEALLRRLQGALHAAARAGGWTVDHDGDLAQLLRMPDTFNLDRPKGKLIKVVHFPRVKTAGAGAAGDHRYHAGDFADLPEPPEEPALERLLRGLSAPSSAPRRYDLEPILEGCAWLDHGVKNARRLRREEYKKVVAVVARCFLRTLKGGSLVHRLSEQHPGYNPAITDEQIDLALHVDPPTCRAVGGRSGAREAHCRRCVHLGRIEGPLDLGHTAAADTPGPAVVDPVAACDPVAGGPVPIQVTTREGEVNDRALAALAASEPNVFARGGLLVEVARPDAARHDAGETHGAALDRAPGSPLVRPIGEPRMRELLARHCAFQAPAAGREAPRSLHPPRWVVRALLARGRWPELPALAGVVECPVLRPGGSVLERPGYDAESGLFYAPSEDFLEVPSAPPHGRALEALEQLREAVHDFPFQTGAFAAWLCSLLTPLARAAFSGPSPLNLIEANVRGCGKSLLADVCSVLLTGRPAARMSLPGSEAELRKAITALASEAERTVLLDNVSGVLGSPTLDRALTAEIWRDRVLGASRQLALPLAITWYATGNNLALAGDTARRCLHIRLHSPVERPERRAGFRHPRLLAWLRRERFRLLPAAVTLLRAYLVAGRPRQPLVSWGSYESWSDLVRSTVVWLGLPDPAETGESDDRHAHDTAGRGVHHDLVFGLVEVLDDLGRSATAGQILQRLARAPGAYPLLRSALAELFPRLAAGSAGQLPTAIKLAGRLRSYRGRAVRGACIDRASKHHQVARWTVRKVSGR